jgi:hypothetical protein
MAGSSKILEECFSLPGGHISKSSKKPQNHHINTQTRCLPNANGPQARLFGVWKERVLSIPPDQKHNITNTGTSRAHHTTPAKRQPPLDTKSFLASPPSLPPPPLQSAQEAIMGTGMCGKKPRHSAKKKQYKKALCTARRPKDVDQIQVRQEGSEAGREGGRRRVEKSKQMDGRWQNLSCPV